VGQKALVGGEGDITLVGRRARVENGTEVTAGARLPEPEKD
jgi:glucose-1-phosphate adenylyltransferase